MRTVRLPRELLDAIGEDARESYPNECCGFLIAEPEPLGASSPRSIVSVDRAPNSFAGEKRRRFLLRPEEVRAAEQRAEATGRLLAGFYHSHPDHPARPSRFDQDHAWPWYTYIVVTVEEGRLGTARAYELNADTLEFAETPLVVVEPARVSSVVRG